MRKSEGVVDHKLAFERIISKRVGLLCVGLLSVAMMSCGKQDAGIAPASLTNPSLEQQETEAPVSTGSEVASLEKDSVSSVGEIETSHDEGLRLAFAGMKTEAGSMRFKVYDWELEQEAWVSEGEDYRGYAVVGLDPSGKDVLVLERNEYWFVYPLEHLQLDSGMRGEKPKILMASDIPEGVSIMDYITANTEPLNPPDMPPDLQPGPVVDMDALIAGQTAVNSKPDGM